MAELLLRRRTVHCASNLTMCANGGTHLKAVMVIIVLSPFCPQGGLTR
jgi:hypothetical protein